MMRIHHLFVSLGHNYSGHPGGPPGDRSAIEVNPIKCVAGRCMRNDRLFGQLPDQSGKTVGTGNNLKIQAGCVYGEAKDTVTGGKAKAITSDIRSQMQIQF